MELVYIAILGTTLLMAAELRDFLRQLPRRSRAPLTDATAGGAPEVTLGAAVPRSRASEEALYDAAA